MAILELPDPEEWVIPNVKWGKYNELFTAAYWAAQIWLDSLQSTYSKYKMGNSLQEEIVACVLGGYGIQAEIGLAAFKRLLNYGLLSSSVPSENDLHKALSEPFCLYGRKIHYRFAKQRSRYLAVILQHLAIEKPPQTTDCDFRSWLLKLPGIGPKTASWITRNWLNSDSVAIIDIHIYRAGLLAGVFEPTESITKHYFRMEDKFLSFARAINARPSILDTLIWCQMRDAGRIALEMVKKEQSAYLYTDS